jgi:hypothetical protein
MKGQGSEREEKRFERNAFGSICGVVAVADVLCEATGLSMQVYTATYTHL